MNDARKQVFAMEANDAINVASLFLMNNSISGDSNAKLFPVGTTLQCVLVSEMAASGDFDVDTSKYKGYVLIRKKEASVYEYRITMTNGALLVSNKGASDIASSDVVDLGEVTVADTCPASLTWPSE